MSVPVDIVLVGAEEEENLSLRYLAAACEGAGQSARIVAFNAARDLPAALDNILSEPARVVGLSMAFQSRVMEFAQLGHTLRERGFPGHITAGGHFATLQAELLLSRFPWLDSIVLHEAEESLPELLRALECDAIHTVAGVVTRGRGWCTRALPPIDALPWPRRDAVAPRKLGIGTAVMAGSRGCYGSCNFCSVQAWYKLARGPRFRQRPADDIAEEMAWLRRERGVQIFSFIDDNFFVSSSAANQRRADALVDAVLARDLRKVAWSFKCRPDDLNPGLLQRLMQVPIVLVYLGIETATEQGIATLGRRVSPQSCESSLRLLAEHRVLHTFNVQLFDPDTTLDSLGDNLSLLRAWPGVPWNFGQTQVYAATPLEDRLLADDRLQGDPFAWSYSLADRRADWMMRAALTVFFKRNFHAEGIAALNLSTRYGLEVLRLFGGEGWDEALQREAEALSAEVGRCTVRALESLLAMARDAALDDLERSTMAVPSLARDVHRADFEFLRRFRELRTAIESRMGRLSPRPPAHP
jgi:hypothetical protein